MNTLSLSTIDYCDWNVAFVQISASSVLSIEWCHKRMIMNIVSKWSFTDKTNLQCWMRQITCLLLGAQFKRDSNSIYLNRLIYISSGRVHKWSGVHEQWSFYQRNNGRKEWKILLFILLLIKNWPISMLRFGLVHLLDIVTSIHWIENKKKNYKLHLEWWNMNRKKSMQ